MVSSKVTSVYRLRAQPKASNPGPRLAVVAGTRMVTDDMAELLLYVYGGNFENVGASEGAFPLNAGAWFC